MYAWYKSRYKMHQQTDWNNQRSWTDIEQRQVYNAERIGYGLYYEKPNNSLPVAFIRHMKR